MPYPGQLLLAAPSLGEPFEHAVILLVEHDESGSLGVVLNQPSTLAVSEVLPQWRSVVSGEQVVFSGGPVGMDSALALAAVRGEAEPAGFRRVSGGIGVGIGLIDLDADPDLMAVHVDAMRVFAGYAGWAPAQLQGELDEGSWVVVDPTDPSVDPFELPVARQWAILVARQPGTVGWWVHCPRDPRLN